MLVLTTEGKPAPVKTYLPFCTGSRRNKSGYRSYLGEESDPSKRYFTIGNPLDMDAGVCLDLDRLTERSNGIFGKTGTGKPS